MIDALFNVAVFVTLAVCIVGFGAWAHRRCSVRALALCVSIRRGGKPSQMRPARRGEPPLPR
jgi:hypothetical protein